MQYIAAVDLGTTKVIMAIGKRGEKNKLEIVAIKEIASKGVIKGDVRNLKDAHTVILEVKQEIEEELNITISEVLIAISGKHIQCSSDVAYITVQNAANGFSEITQEDVDRLSRDTRSSHIDQIDTILDVIPLSYKVDEDTDITEPIGMEGKRLEGKFTLIKGDIGAIGRIERCFQRAGLEMLPPMLQPIASAEAVLTEDEKELGVAVIDIGGGTTDLCVYYDKVIRHIAVIPIGGDIINTDIKAYGILDKFVEKVKIQCGEAIADKAPNSTIEIKGAHGKVSKTMHVKKLAGIIEARMYDIIDLAEREISKATRGSKLNLGAGIVLTGGGVNLKNIDLLFQKKLGYDVRVASPGLNLEKGSVEKVNSPKYSTVVGVLLTALKKNLTTQIDGVPADEQLEGVNNQAQQPVAEQPSYDQRGQQNNYAQEQEQQYEQAPQHEFEPEPYYNEEQDFEPRKVKVPAGTKLKNMFNNIFSEKELIDDDEDNY